MDQLYAACVTSMILRIAIDIAFTVPEYSVHIYMVCIKDTPYVFKFLTTFLYNLYLGHSLTTLFFSISRCFDASQIITL